MKRREHIDEAMPEDQYLGPLGRIASGFLTWLMESAAEVWDALRGR